MEKITFIILGLIVFYFVIGLYLIAFPEGMIRTRNALLRSLRALSEQEAHRSVTPQERMQSRIIGGIFIAGTIFILTQISWQWGTFSENTPTVPPITSAEGNSEEARLHQRVVEIVGPIARNHVGLVVATIAGDARDISGFGRVHLASDATPNGETIFEIGSLSKVFTGILLAESIQRADLSLTTPIASLLPNFANLSESQAASITLEHLVTHTSGLPRMPTPSFRFRPVTLWNAIVAGDSYQYYTERDLQKLVTKKTLRSTPGAEFEYSNAGFGLLGHIISQRYGQEYHALINTMIAAPLGMKDTGITLNQEQEKRFASGYRSCFCLGTRYLAQRSAHWNFPNCMAGAGGLRSNANDMLLFLAANMNRTISDVTPALQSSHKVLFTKDATQIGMAWFHKPLPGTGESIIWHNGETGGFASFLGFTANGRVGVCVLSNSARSVDHIGETLLEMLISTHLQPTER